MNAKLISQIDAILPQTQCTRCGYPSCREYAEALANNQADINQCPPGGDKGIEELAHLLNKPKKPLNPSNGTIKPRQLAIIDEDVCIGCTLCIKACPVDAILGSNKMMHTVISSECTGCDLCIPVCPVDCILTVEDQDQNWSEERKSRAKYRFEQHNDRKERERLERESRLRQQAELLKHVRGENIGNKLDSQSSNENKLEYIEQILAKAKQRR